MLVLVWHNLGLLALFSVVGLSIGRIIYKLSIDNLIHSTFTWKEKKKKILRWASILTLFINKYVDSFSTFECFQEVYHSCLGLILAMTTSISCSFEDKNEHTSMWLIHVTGTLFFFQATNDDQQYLFLVSAVN